MFETESFKHLSTKLVARKLEEQGYTITDEQLAVLEEQIANAGDDVLTIELPDDDRDINLQIDISEKDIDRAINEYTEKLSDKMPRIIEDLSKVILANLKNRASEMLSEHKNIRGEFEQRLSRKWGEACDLLEMLIVISTEAGDDFNNEFRLSASQDDDFEFDVLTRLHARSCQIANEILTLLRAGYADGAHARWRTMHEITVIGYFVRRFGQDVAERYLLHDAVESYRATQQYQRHCTRLGYEPLTNRELSQIRSTYQRLLNRFGRDYASSYGWAAQALRMSDPKFSDIEQAVDLEHWRPYYKLASHNVHANPKGVFFRLGLYPEGQELLLVGPSDTGFADPGHGTAISLMQITTCLLTIKPNIDRLSTCYVLGSLVEEIGDTFLSVQN